ncbi:hypothetical protein FGU46_05050 [Methanobacterium sp. CWC-01]|uniref:hypothetical protein n=1 Tax=Methanobacterium aridiramus TaxID=2584467 RepID=UPI00257643B7|nr:hypothetical protein [Methanobacterium sp. CWC-01]WJI09503.1 hypothetical protein FGU46_05050 [Methanobacterium sp. CWC-01]
MIEKAIENWLTKTNETNYRAAFFQVLLNEYELVKNTHGPLEDGKDIIAIDSDGNYHAFQLKSGNMNLTDWRNIKSQIDELVEIPINHPSFKPGQTHQSHLVMNGVVNSYAISKINGHNSSYVSRGYNELKIIDIHELLKMFKKAQGKFIPQEFDDFSLFLGLLNSDGRDLLPKDQFIDFLDQIIFSRDMVRESDKINAVSSSLIIVSYLLDPFQNKENYFALFEAWTCLAASIMRFAHKSGLKDKWEESVELIMLEIKRNLSLLQDEVLEKKDFFEGSMIGENRASYNSRILLVLGTLSTLEIHLSLVKEDYKVNEELFELIKENQDNYFFWGESAFPFLFSIIKYLEKEDENEIAYSLLENMFLSIVNRNQPNKDFGFPNPYYNLRDVLEGILRLEFELKSYHYILTEIMAIDVSKEFAEVLPQIRMVGKNKPGQFEKVLNEILVKSNLKKIDFKEFNGSSFILETLILMLVRRNKKKTLMENWHDISYIRFETFEFDNNEDIFTWRCRDGKVHDELPKTPEKWNNLVSESKKLDPILSSYDPSLLLFFALVYPHRANKSIINYLDLYLTVES